MSFPLTAADDTEHSISITRFCGYEVNSCTIKTSAGYAILNVANQSSMVYSVLISFCGKMGFVTVQGKHSSHRRGRS
ncbi:hypothetical protein NMCA_22600 [Enterobacter ludwigii]|nr:hypothetical protein NMCA_22600 [Enterobacter ludwigii]